MRSCQCPHCNEFFCNSCYLPVHKGKSCAEVEAIAQAGPAPIVESDEVKKKNKDFLKKFFQIIPLSSIFIKKLYTFHNRYIIPISKYNK